MSLSKDTFRTTDVTEEVDSDNDTNNANLASWAYFKKNAKVISNNEETTFPLERWFLFLWQMDGLNMLHIQEGRFALGRNQFHDII